MWHIRSNTINIRCLLGCYIPALNNDFFRSSPTEMFLIKGVLKICSSFTGEHPCWSVISIKLLCNFCKITSRYGCSSVNLLHVFRKPFSKNTSRGMFLFFYIFIISLEQILNIKQIFSTHDKYWLVIFSLLENSTE